MVDRVDDLWFALKRCNISHENDGFSRYICAQFRRLIENLNDALKIQDMAL